MSRPAGPRRESLWEKAVRQPGWGRPLQLVVTGIVIAGAAFAVLSFIVVGFFGLIAGW
jgi:hypothetical protein